MSKRRSIILSVTIEGRSQAETARLYSVSESTVSRLLTRYRTEGDAAFEPRSRRPKTSPTRVADVVNEMIVNLRVDLTSRGLDAGPATIQWHLERDGHTVSISTIRRRLLDAGLIEPAPKKRPKSSYIRFEADLPNETWQSDFTHYRLTDGTDTEVLVWLDDHSRYALSITAHDRVTGDLVVDTFNQTGEKQGFPASVLTDNGSNPKGCRLQPPDSPATEADATPSRHASPNSTSNRRTPPRTIQPPAARSNASTRP